MKVGVVFISDRGDRYLPDCRASFHAHLVDSEQWLTEETVIDDRDHQLGMSGAVNAAWRWAVSKELDLLFHVEEDFVFRSDFSLRAMSFALAWGRDICQLVLKRQPWSPEEVAVGNIIRSIDDSFSVAQQDMHTDALGTIRWTTHNKLFSLNPCLLPYSTFSEAYPAGNEAAMTTRMASQGLRFAYFGGIDDPPLVEHVGHVRGQGWKL